MSWYFGSKNEDGPLSREIHSGSSWITVLIVGLDAQTNAHFGCVLLFSHPAVADIIGLNRNMINCRLRF